MLAAALACCWFSPALPFLGIAALVCASLAGLTFPDVDQFVPLLRHRSAVTHSMMVVLLCLADRRLHPVAAGMALGIGFHLAADCFPVSMRGFATVKVPFAGTLDTEGSYVWLAVNAIMGSYIFGVLVERLYGPQMQWAALFGALVLGGTYLSTVPGGFRALLVYGVIGWIGWRLHRLPTP